MKNGHAALVGFMIIMVFIATGLIGCSSGGGGGGGGITAAGPASAISVGTMKRGSVIVNGVEFTGGGGAAIRIDDNPGRPETELRDGMQVKVKGTINDDKITGNYSSVHSEPEVRGKLAGPGVDDFSVNGQHVFIDSRTVFEDRSALGVFSQITFTALAVDDNIEIHGGRDASGRVHATRVERRHDAQPDEVRGTITTTPNGATFSLATGSGTITVNYSISTQITPTGATLNLNDTVEVHGTFSAGIMTATRIDREDLEDVEFEPAEGQELEVEGFVSGFTASPGIFQVGSQTVQTTAATRYVGGVSADLANGVEVETEGHANSGGVLVADKIKFEANVRIEANADASGSAGVLGKTVAVTSTTELISLASVTAIAAGDGLRIRGFLNSDGVSFTATRVEKLGSPVSKVILQGPVAAKTTATLTIAGLTVDLSSASTFQDNNGVAIVNLTQFLARVTPGSTVVKAKGNFSSSTLTAEEAELEE